MRSLLFTTKPHKSSWSTKNLYNLFTRFVLPILTMLCWESNRETFWKLKSIPIPLLVKTPTYNRFEFTLCTYKTSSFISFFFPTRITRVVFLTTWWVVPRAVLILGVPLPSFMFVRSSLFPITCLETSLSTNQFEVSKYWHRFSCNTFIAKVLVLFRASLQSWKLSTSSSLLPWSCLLSF